LRLLDVFVLRSDEIFGEQVLTKVLGLILILAYAWRVKGTLRGLGLHGAGWQKSGLLGLGMMTAGLLLGYGAEYLTLLVTGAAPTFYLAPEGNTLIPNDAATGGFLFALTLILGNVINSFMEEGLFRGVLSSHLGARMSLGKANLAQAVLFGVWHIPGFWGRWGCAWRCPPSRWSHFCRGLTVGRKYDPNHPTRFCREGFLRFCVTFPAET
jgi:membrane protease YdiL (CAAX protease family)